MDRLLATQRQPDRESRRHHYVPRTYLKRWGFGNLNRRIWNLDTDTGDVRAFSVNDVCVEENFYRVIGPDGEAHKRVEAIFGVVDAELGRIPVAVRATRGPRGAGVPAEAVRGVDYGVQTVNDLHRRLQC